MEKISAVARILVVILAVASAFVVIPYTILALLVLGGLSALGEDNSKTYLVAIVLTVGAQALDAVPAIGSELVAIFGGIGTAAIGASIVAITISILCRIKTDWS